MIRDRGTCARVDQNVFQEYAERGEEGCSIPDQIVGDPLPLPSTRRSGFRAGVPNVEGLRKVQQARASWNLPPITLRLGAGRSQVQILSPRPFARRSNLGPRRGGRGFGVWGA